MLLLLIILIRGLMTPSLTYETSTTVNRTASEAWNVINDPSNSLSWIEGFTKSELLSGSKGKAGAVSNVYLFEGANEMIMEETITEIIRNEKMVMTYKLGPMAMDYAMTLTESNGKTTISSRTETRGIQFIGKMILPWMSSNMKANEDKNLQNLKSVIEKN